MARAPGFIFGGNTNISAEQLARDRHMAEVFASRLGVAPRNVGEGLTSIGNALAARGLNKRAVETEAAGRERANKVFSGLNLPGFGGGTSAPTPGPVQLPGASVPEATDPVIAAIIKQESGGNPNAVSPVGARGLMQVMPASGRDPGFGVKPLANDTPQENVRFGTDYFNAMLKRYGGDQRRALVAYNWGPGNADKWDGNLASLPEETQGYVRNIEGSLSQQAPAGGQPQPQQVAGGPSIAELTTARSDPFLSPGKKAFIDQLIEQRIKQRDPSYRLGLEKNRLEVEQLRGAGERDQRDFDAAERDRLRDDERADRRLKLDEGKPASASIAEYNQYAEIERAAGREPLGPLQYRQALKGKGITIGPDGTVQIGGGAGAGSLNLSKGQIEVDKTFAKDFYVPFKMGGASDNEKQTEQLQLAVDALESGENITGPLIAALPETVRAGINPEAVNTQELVAEVAQRNLREILGGQFAQKEGEQLINRAFNPSLPEAVNAERVKRLMRQMKAAAAAKRAAIDYYDENGTLAGWKGKLPSINDFDPRKGEGSGGKSDREVGDDGWTVEVVE